jgi:quercetin dioxygenase-like cupin family protein
MRVTRFELDGDQVRTHIAEQPDWKPFDTYDGEPLRDVTLTEVHEVARAEVQLVHIAAGGHFVMHTSPDLAFCHIVRGSGTLRLPDGSELTYEGPELYLFEPGTLHEWDQITADTLLAVCLVREPDRV